MSFRIIGGTFRNRLLIVPKGDKTRPTSAIVRKSVFDICKNSIEDAVFLDLFAGSGAMGIEAISRGAKSATFVDQDKNAIRAIYENCKTLQIEETCEVILANAIQALKRLETQKKQFTLIYVDPPYVKSEKNSKENLYATILEFLDKSPLLVKEGELFMEEGSPSVIDIPSLSLTNLHLESTRNYGKSFVHHFTKR